MPFQFNAESIFDIGIQIEKNGKMFYQIAAQHTQDERLRSLFTELAAWEDKHIQLFQKLQADLPENARDDLLFDPHDERGDYLQAAADSHVFVANTDIAQLVTARCNTPVDALELALAFEKDSVVYYTTIKKSVSEHSGRDKIDLLIDEELTHIAILHTKKKQFV